MLSHWAKTLPNVKQRVSQKTSSSTSCSQETSHLSAFSSSGHSMHTSADNFSRFMSTEWPLKASSLTATVLISGASNSVKHLPRIRGVSSPLWPMARKLRMTASPQTNSTLPPLHFFRLILIICDEINMCQFFCLSGVAGMAPEIR